MFHVSKNVFSLLCLFLASLLASSVGRTKIQGKNVSEVSNFPLLEFQTSVTELYYFHSTKCAYIILRCSVVYIYPHTNVTNEILQIIAYDQRLSQNLKSFIR